MTIAGFALLLLAVGASRAFAIARRSGGSALYSVDDRNRALVQDPIAGIGRLVGDDMLLLRELMTHYAGWAEVWRLLTWGLVGAGLIVLWVGVGRPSTAPAPSISYYMSIGRGAGLAIAGFWAVQGALSLKSQDQFRWRVVCAAGFVGGLSILLVASASA